MIWSDKELRKQPDEAMLGGVCAGLARYFELDVSLIRAGFLASMVFGGFGLAAYVALWILLDDAEAVEPPCSAGGIGDEEDEVDVAAGPESVAGDALVGEEGQRPATPAVT